MCATRKSPWKLASSTGSVKEDCPVRIGGLARSRPASWPSPGAVYHTEYRLAAGTLVELLLYQPPFVVSGGEVGVGLVLAVKSGGVYHPQRYRGFSVVCLSLCSPC